MEPLYSPSSAMVVVNWPSNSSVLGRLVIRWTIPAVVFLPNRIPCGPFSTSMRSTSTISLNREAEEEAASPSIMATTLGSIPRLAVSEPTPRRAMVLEPGLVGFKNVRDGVSAATSIILVSCASLMASAENTLMDLGTSCKDCSRLVAVTRISSIWDCAGTDSARLTTTAMVPRVMARFDLIMVWFPSVGYVKFSYYCWWQHWFTFQYSR